ncbi:hypothetical protein CEXT_200291 [Caerostris extrusa]|uniref:Pre-C2HC domain-containing protein n=1 Tax=Caerostris extrusa TaxID=172846 RepID=A0AAV4R0Z6_CAEEX|nr:hypothetical protein CEXT_200291 [Caerostris extrusa]
MCILLKSAAPSMRSVLSRDRFLKLTVTSEVEHLRLKNKLVQLGLEFKCFNLKQDRPIKVLIRGLPSLTSKEAIQSAINALGYKTATQYASKINKPMQAPQSRIQPPASNRSNFADIAAGRATSLTPPTEAPLNKSAMEFLNSCSPMLTTKVWTLTFC